MTSTLPTFENIDLMQHGTGTGPVLAIGDTLPSSRISGLLPCDDWDAAEYRMPGRICDVAINVTITGRVQKYWCGTMWMRCRVEFVGDGEPSTFCGGWVRMS